MTERTSISGTGTSRGRRSFWRWVSGALRENLGLKLMCFIFALSLVAYQRSQEDAKIRTIAIQLDAQLPPEVANRELMAALPVVKLTVEGSTRALDKLMASTPSFNLDLRDGTTEELHFLPEDFDVPPGVKIKFIEPARFKLEWQDVITRSVPVQSSVTGNVAEGYDVESLSTDPPAVPVRGPKNLVQVIQFVRVAPFDVAGLSEGSYSRLLALDPAPERTRYVGPPSVTVSVEVRRRLVTQPFRAVPVEVIGLHGARSSPAQVDVRISGPPEVVHALSREQIVPRAIVENPEAAAHGSQVAKVQLDLLQVQVEIQPPSVTLSW